MSIPLVPSTTSTAPLRELLEPLLPEGVKYDDLYPLKEQLAPLGPLTTDRTAERTDSRSGLLTQDDYRDIIKQQDTLKSSYVDSIQALLDRAEEGGPRSQRSVMRSFGALANRYLAQAHRLGMETTATNPVLDQTARDYVKDRVEHEKEHFLDFLQKIWNGEERMDRDQRRDMYGRTIDSMWTQGALAGTPNDVVITWVRTAKESCEDCIYLSETGPFSKPGVTDGPYVELPTVPRRGETQCLSNCLCYLEFERLGDIVGSDRGVEPGYEIEPEEGEDLLPEGEAAAELQEEVDALGQKMQWARAMYDSTGDESYLQIRKEANDELIDLQEEHGVRLVPRTEADAMSEVVSDGVDLGYEPTLPEDNSKLTAGMDAALVDGIDFYHGTLTDWDEETGTGSFEDNDGKEFPVSTTSDPPNILMVEGKKNMLDRPWKIPEPRVEGGFVSQIPGHQVSYAEDIDPTFCNPGLREDVSPCDPTESIHLVRRVVDRVPREHSHGLQFRFGFDSATGAGYRVDGDILLFAGVMIDRGYTEEERIAAAFQAVGAHVYANSLTRGSADAYMDRIRRAVATRASYALGLGDEETAFGLLYEWALTDPESLDAIDPELAEWIEDETRSEEVAAESDSGSV